jgi:hypothetical protein
VRKYPDRFAIMGWFYLDDPQGRDLVAHWKEPGIDSPGAVGPGLEPPGARLLRCTPLSFSYGYRLHFRFRRYTVASSGLAATAERNEV